MTPLPTPPPYAMPRLADAADRGDGVAVWRRIADAIEAEIAAGTLAAGAQLPTEAQLAERFRANRHTVRRALAALASRGLVRATQGRGTFVEAKPLAYPVGGRARFAENVASAGREASSRVTAAGEVPATGRVAEALGTAEGAPVLQVRAIRYADASPVALSLVHVPLPRFAGFDRHFAETGSLTRAFEALGLPDYVRKETRVAARLADPAEALALEMAAGRLVIVAEGLNVDADGHAVQLVRSVFPADRVELVFT